MDRELGASILLSFAVVAVAAVALHRPEANAPPQANLTPTAPPPPAPPPRPERPRGAWPEPTPGVPLDESGREVAGVTSPGPRRVSPAAFREPEPSARPAKPRRPESAFTVARDGETLADVALRVYGTRDVAERLGRFNRDQIDRHDAPLPAGTLLRTPDMEN